MRTSTISKTLGLLALLGSSASMAASVIITASTLTPTVGETFTMTLTGNVENTFTGSIALAFDATTVAYVSGAPLSPFTVYTKNSLDDANPTVFDVEAPTTQNQGGAFYDVTVLTFMALAPGAAGIVIDDDGGMLTGWFDADTFDYIPSTYTQANVVVAGGVVLDPVIVVTDSIPPADDLALPYGDVQLASTSTETVTVTNTGGAALVIDAIGALAAPFSLNPDMCGGQTLAPAESCVITVDFAPVAAQADTADLVITSNDPANATVTVQITGTGTVVTVPNIVVTDSVAPIDDRNIPFGVVTAGVSVEETVTVTNDGSADLVIGTVAIGTAPGPLSDPFVPINDMCAGQTLAPASSCTVGVVYTPVAAITSTTNLDISSNDPDPNKSIVSVALSGTGTLTPAPIAAVSDSVAPADDLLIPFGNVTIGGTSPVETVTVSNTGTADLVIGTIAVANPLLAPFLIGNDGCSGQTVAPAGSCTIEVQFEPVALGAFPDGFDIPSDAAGSPITFNVSGTGAPVPVPDITVTDSVPPVDDLAVPFGTVAVLATQSETITVTNDGSADLVITNVVAPAAPFSLSSDLCNGQTLASTDSCVITVAFTPDGAQVYNGSVSVLSNDPDDGTVVVALSGTGSDAPVGEIVIDGGSSAFDPWSLALLGGLPFLRRRRKAAARLTASVLAVVAAVVVLAAPPAAVADDRWDWDYDGFYLGAGVIGTSLETSDQFNSAIQAEFDSSGNFEDFAYGGQVYAGWMFNNFFGIEGRWSDSGDGESDILFVDGGGSRMKIGDIEGSLDGWTVYGVANWPIAQRWDLFAKAGYTDLDIDLDATVDGESFSASDDDSGFAGALGARWRFARHWATTVEGEYLGVDYDSVIDEPWRVGLNIEYWFGGNEIPPPPPPPPARVAVVPPPPPPPPPMDSDGDGVVDPSDKCADTPRGDRVDTVGCSCDVSRQLTFKTDSAELSDADMLVLDDMAANLTKLNFISGVIEGHTDSTGAEGYNQGLSERRAQSAADYLASKGIASDRLQVVGRGESDPIGDNGTADGRALNRRVTAKRTDCSN